MPEKNDIKQRVFDVIYEEPDIDKGVNAALALVGEDFGISRVYIFENNEQNTESDNTFEWCAPGIEPQIDELQNMSFEEYDYASMFDESGLFFSPDVSALPEPVKDLLESQGIRATLQYGIFDKGVFRGFVGFDDCEGARPDWQDDGVSLNTLVYISRLLSVCLLKERNLQKAQMLHQELENALKTEQEIRAAATKAAEAKTSFLSRMSHDMRTPMNGILGLAALSQDENDPEILRQNMLKIRNSGEYLLGLINDILDTQKIETGRLELNPQVVDGIGFIDDMIDMIRRFAREKEIDFKTIISKKEMEGYVRIDPIRAKQICINLLSNAVKFTPVNGKVEFRIDGEDISEKLRRVTITVQDSGVGMSPEFLENGIYKSFSQEYNSLSSQNVSTGLGLSIVKRLVELMGGEISVKSELQKGTVFTVVLMVERVHDVAAAKIVMDDERHGEALRSTLSGRRVLLCEDHPLNAEVASRLLARLGCETVWAEDGEKGLELFEKSHPDFFDAVLMDIRMPRMDGLTTAKAIRALERLDAKTIPIIAMTANAYSEDIRASIDAGMNDHLAKPIEPQLLYETLAFHMNQSSEDRIDTYSFMPGTPASYISDVDMNSLQELVQSVLSPGAFAVEYDAFRNIYEFLSRNIARLRNNAQLLLFTIDEDEGHYKELSDSIRFCLRSGDLMMEFNERQIVALLVNCDEQGGEIVAGRILAAFRRRPGNSGVSLRCDISGVESKA